MEDFLLLFGGGWLGSFGLAQVWVCCFFGFYLFDSNLRQVLYM